MAAQAEEFDPYRQWLGISAEEQPASHYRLLGLKEFESNPDVISHSADRVMERIRAHRRGPQAAWSERLLNELAAAKVCLLDSRRKETYDRSLRVKRGIQNLPRPDIASRRAPAGDGPLTVEPLQQVGSETSAKLGRTVVSQRQARKRMRELTTFLVLLCVLVGLVITAWVLFRR